MVIGSGSGDASGLPPEVTNSLSGVVVGPSLQTGAVHGDVHVHLDSAAATAQSAVDIAAALQAALGPPADVFRRQAVEQLLADLEAVHRDYLVMFESILEKTPAAWERETPDFAERVRAVAELLRRLRLAYEPVRVRVHSTAEALHGTAVRQPERVFVDAVLAYFPTGELRVDEEHHPWRTSGTAVLDHLYRALDGELGQELRALIAATLALHRQRWLEVCRAHAALRLGGGAGG
ncbi:hypothetical protein GCM10012286_64450 [Streptomyces lasiicapitis]|uniref:Uncharacterized protein n=1 Tax=Streptomyces lasiicapitis TaxID=1923961 RepID=A0ABQ2MN10_9ACTN|nr:hypothetical protein GCM10012286_64450 [Streptomyces lasiicapitis]